MSTAHQVITGALNKGENVYATGTVDGATFIACAVGSDVVILGADFSRVQIIPGCSHHTEQLVTSVSCCHDSGKIAATYGNIIRVFEPTSCFQYNTFWFQSSYFIYLTCISRPGSTAPVMFSIDQPQDACSWDIVWSVKLAQRPKYIKFSPDGMFLAVSGENDYLVKLFYQESVFGFVPLYHPAPVRGLEWRRTGRYMPRKCIQAVLMTWCVDNTSRIWKETPPPELAIIDLNGDGGEPSWERSRPRKIFGKHFRVKKTRNKIINKLRGIVPEKRRRGEELPHALGLRAQIGKSSSFSDLQCLHHYYNNVQFHLAATINAETDCMLVPSMENGGVLQKPLCVHWLNNKELVFSIGAEKLLAESAFFLGLATMSPCDNAENESPPTNGQNEKVESTNNTFGSVCSESLSSKDVLDVKLEILLRQWSRSNDVLFTIHPVDGSLLIWTVEWLDDLHRQPVISFTSRFPSAFPITDASSLHPTLNTFNPHEPIYVDVLRREEGKDPGLLVFIWHTFAFVADIVINQVWLPSCFNLVVAHPVLPLLLTTSQFRSGEIVENTCALSEVVLWKIAPVGPLCKSGGVKELARVANPSRSGFDRLGWIPVILPSYTLGTVCNSPSSCFIASDGRNLVIYQAVVDASELLAEIYNSTRQKKFTDFLLRLVCYHHSVGLLQQFNVVSTQSTAKPGCVLEVGQIPNVVQPDSELLLLHVFPERLVINDGENNLDDNQGRISSVVDRSKAAVFNDRYFVVIIEHGSEYENFIMYSVVISSQRPRIVSHFGQFFPLYDS
ncbi:unnamed protein product [Angiostrongylus costaricensis]|uniref:DmX-like protein 2 n=1 Tax=Angiostrongylus costaricensis TaxID=334426 RepID=A0A0R3PZL5_ANGCS|nr:unnamed protein product [Angiostrongylus costaricensis]